MQVLFMKFLPLKFNGGQEHLTIVVLVDDRICFLSSLLVEVECVIELAFLLLLSI